MSNFLAAAAVTSTLSQILRTAVQADVSGADVAIGRPDSPPAGTPPAEVNVFLYQVAPNAAWRNADLPTRTSDGEMVRRPQAALDLFYLLTFSGSENDLEPERLLGSTVSTLQSRSVLTPDTIRRVISEAVATDPDHFLAGVDLADQVERIKFTPVALNLEELSKLWSVFFQVPYALSVSYRASVVLIEARNIPSRALAVRARNLYTVPTSQPLLERVSAQAGAQLPITSGATLALQGQRLRGHTTRVRIGGVEVLPASDDVSSTQILVTLPNDLQAGVHGIQVVHQWMMGTPPQPHQGVESNAIAFVLRPSIANVAAAGAAQVSVTLNPVVGETQRLVLLLNELQAPSNRAAHGYSFSERIWPENQEETGTVVFPIAGVEPAEYLVRVQVDGAESLLQADPDPNNPGYNGPTVTIP